MDSTPIISEAVTAAPTKAELDRSLRMRMYGQIRRQAHATEVEMKGLFVDWLFSKLNISHLR